jgi:hypothetical protein
MRRSSVGLGRPIDDELDLLRAAEPPFKPVKPALRQNLRCGRRDHD